ncbi:Rhomboid-like protein 11, chloroplastic [Galdieria sulphuraria]|nr:Rhomboid-like protein 11, chloroplastic [Galdieria sulphuraria]
MLWFTGASHFIPQVKTSFSRTGCIRCLLNIRQNRARKNQKDDILRRQWKADGQRQDAFLLAAVQHKPDNQVPVEGDKPQMRAVSLGKTVRIQSSNWPLARNTSEWGVFVLILVNLLLFVASRFIWPNLLALLVLTHSGPRWWQFVTYSFCHESWAHLSNNLFFLLIFGKLVEEEEGAFGIIMSYCICAFGSALLSWMVLPKHSVSVGASGAVFDF